MCLLDTNVLSELTEAQPDPDVLMWYAARSARDLCTSAIVIGELRLGIERMAPGRRRRELDAWYRQQLPGLLGGGILPVDRIVAEHYGRLIAAQYRNGLTRGELDRWILATASVHGLALATRNFRDFGGQGIDIVNPWGPTGTKGMAGTDRW